MSSGTRSVGVLKGVTDLGEPWDDVLSPDAWDELQALQLGEVKLQRLSSNGDQDSPHTSRLNSTSEESVIQMLGVGSLLPPFSYSLDQHQPHTHSTEGYSSDTAPGESPFSHPSPSSPLSSSSIVSSPMPVAGTEGEHRGLWGNGGGVGGGEMYGHFDMGQLELLHQHPHQHQQQMMMPANFKYETTYLSGGEHVEDEHSPDSGMDASNDDDSEGAAVSFASHQGRLVVPTTTSGSRTRQTAASSRQANPKQAVPVASGPRVPKAASKKEQQQQVVPQQQQQQQSQQHTYPTGLSSSVHSALGHLIEITSQPAKFARFRYKNEKRSQQLEGECGPIEVTLRPDVITRARNVTVRVSLITSSGTLEERKKRRKKEKNQLYSPSLNHCRRPSLARAWRKDPDQAGRKELGQPVPVWRPSRGDGVQEKQGE